MKKLVAIMLGTALISSVFFCGCGETIETTAAQTEITTQTEATTTETEPAPIETKPKGPELNMDNLIKVSELYSSKMPTGEGFVTYYADGIRGDASYKASTDEVYFSYTSVNGGSSIQMYLDRSSRSCRIYFDLQYAKSRYYGCGNTSMFTVEAFIDDVIENREGAFDRFDESAYKANAETVKKDVQLLYSRFIAMADKAFPEIGLGLEDIGVVLGSKYRDIDPAQPMSTEPVVKNDHKYKNGKCTDCKKLWTEYFYSAIGKLTNTKNGVWHSVYGQKSSSMISVHDYVQCSSNSKKDGDVFYHHMDEKNNTRSCRIYAYKSKKTLKTSIRFENEQKMFSLGRGVVGYKYVYWVTVSAKPGQYNKIFASKEAFKKAAKVELIVFNSKGQGSYAWTKKANIKKLKASFEKDGCTYYTKDQILDVVWEDHEAMFESMDKGMVWLDTSLADMGINWKN